MAAESRKRKLDTSVLTPGAAEESHLREGAAPDGAPPGLLPSLGPFVRVKLSFSERFWRELVLCLQSGLLSQVSWSLNVLQVLSFTDKDRWQRALTRMGHLSSILEALIVLIEEGRVGAGSGDAAAAFRSIPSQGSPWLEAARAEGDASAPGAPSARMTRAHPGEAGKAHPGTRAAENDHRNNDELRQGVKAGDGAQAAPSIQVQAVQPAVEPTELWWASRELLPTGSGARQQHLQCAVAASSILRNMSFFADVAPAMARRPKLVGCLAGVVRDWGGEDPELVTYALDCLQNIAPALRLDSLCTLEDGHTDHLPGPHPFAAFLLHSAAPSQRPTAHMTGQGQKQGASSTCGVRALLSALQEMLWSPVRAWHCAAAEAFARLMASGRPGNAAFLLPLSAENELLGRLGMLLAGPDVEVKASVVAAIASFAEASAGCRQRLVKTPRLLHRLLQCPMALPPAFVDVSRKIAATVYSLTQESTTRDALRKYEGQLVLLACSDVHKAADVFARVLQRVSEEAEDAALGMNAEGRNIWGAAFEQ